MNFSKSCFWGGNLFLLAGGAMYCFERFSAYISQAIITAGYTSHGMVVNGTQVISVQLSSNKLVLPFLFVGFIFMLIGFILGIRKAP